MAAENVIDNSCPIDVKSSSNPRIILLFSGKRKSGKDFITNVLHERIGPDSVILRLSGPIKAHWAKSMNLDIDGLLGDGEYKEKYRIEMAKWGENVRNRDYGYFCRAALDMYNVHDKSIWIVSDVRRKTDIQWFMQNFGSACKTVRILSDDTTRKKRGWIFVPGVDDSETECNLDDVNTWDLEVTNNDDNLEFVLQQIFRLIS
ncbi:phosphomevalonate kinase [Megalopta genalis]|uniref:phosphomevalonate kinase n=1 Tax=Megalopta genalis TaxID=115081 RepID=UPI003FD190C3